MAARMGIEPMMILLVIWTTCCFLFQLTVGSWETMNQMNQQKWGDANRTEGCKGLVFVQIFHGHFGQDITGEYSTRTTNVPYLFLYIKL